MVLSVVRVSLKCCSCDGGGNNICYNSDNFTFKIHQNRVKIQFNASKDG